MTRIEATGAPETCMDHAEYFFFKNGGGNAWMAHSLAHGELYVGFDDTWTNLRQAAVQRAGDPQLLERTTFDFLREEDFAAVKVKQDVRLIYGLARARGEPGRHGFLLTFTPGYLYVWRVVGPLREHRPGTEGWNRVRDQWLRYCKPIGPEPDRALAKHRAEARSQAIEAGVLSSNAIDQLSRHLEFQPLAPVLENEALQKKALKRFRAHAWKVRTEVTADAEGLPIRMLPVELVATVPRQVLFTSVDSISVYRNLNSNTCTSLRTATGTDPTEIRGGVGDWEGDQWPLSTMDDGQLGRLPETGDDAVLKLPKEKAFGQFLRLYLNEVITPYWIGRRPAPVVPVLPRTAMDALLPRVLNPILVETAALALLRDVGLTPDIGVGKGMDIVDIRARAVGQNGLKDPNRAGVAADRLRAVLEQCGEPLAPHASWLEKLRLHGVLDVQCKAAADKLGASRKDILFVGYPRVDRPKVRKSKKQEPPPTLSVMALARWAAPGASEDSELSRFFAMQAAVLRGDWALEARVP